VSLVALAAVPARAPADIGNTGGYGVADWFERPVMIGDDFTSLRVGPVPGLETAPPDATSARFARFNFTTLLTSPSDEPDFECRLDTPEWTACGSRDEGSYEGHEIYSGLADGVHRFEVRAVNASGKVDQTPVEFKWRVDNVPPDTTLDPQPLGSPAYGWSFNPRSSEPSSGTFWVSNRNYEGLAWTNHWGTDARMAGGVGHHRWGFAAIDAAGNIDPTPVFFEFDIADYPDYLPKPPSTFAPPWPGQSATPMKLEVAAGKASTRALAARRAIHVDVQTPVRGTLRIRLKSKGAGELGVRTARLKSAGQRRLKVRLGRSARARLRTRRRLTVVAVATLRPAQGGPRLRATSKTVLGRR
jgi:hypothetical protein